MPHEPGLSFPNCKWDNEFSSLEALKRIIESTIKSGTCQIDTMCRGTPHLPLCGGPGDLSVEGGQAGAAGAARPAQDPQRTRQPREDSMGVASGLKTKRDPLPPSVLMDK